MVSSESELTYDGKSEPMRAARLHAYGEQLRIDEVETPEPGPGEVLIRIASSGACHSDLHVMNGEMPILPELPWILGHENAGHVHALGPGAEGVEIGAPVLVWGGWGCGRCRVCRAGDEQVCDVMRWGGIGEPGGYAEYLVVPSTRNLIAIDDLDPATAAPLTDAALTPYRAVKHALPWMVPGSTVVAIGIGGLGQYGVQFMKRLSAARVVAVDTAEDKRRLAEEFGADVTLDPGEVDVVAELEGMTGGDKASVAIDFVGADATMASAAASIGQQGIFVLVGLAGGSTPVSFMGLSPEATFRTSSWGNRNELAEVVAMAQDGLISGHVEQHPLEDINEVFERLERGEIAGRAVLNP
ncbi:MAG: NAD(P)-dependent alcohol dehydrogenase [Nitriliruptoraceae bacterium]